MSANEGRLRSAIQRIAREDPEIRNTIDGFKDRGGFDSVSTQIAGADDDRGICCDGSSSGNRNPGSETRDPDANAKDGLDPDDPADISDNLTGVVDCETGVPICFEGSDWIPPEGWEDARTQPIDPTWESGFYWRVIITQNGAETGRQYFAGQPIICGFVPCSGEACSGETSTVGCREFSGGTFYGASRSKVSCPETGFESPEVQSICGMEDAPLVEYWPADGCANLAIADGKIVGSKYDPENDGSYSAPRDEIELCDTETGDRILIRADMSGTWKSIKSLDGDIDPDAGYGYLYDTVSGEKIRQISPSEFRDDTV